MGSDQELAEERLLRLIESDSSGIGVVSSEQRTGKAQKPMALLKRKAAIKRRDREDSLLQKLKWFSRLLWVVLIGLGVYVVYAVFLSDEMSPRSLIEQNLSALPAASGPSETTPLNLDKLDVPMADLLAAVTERNPFTGRSAAQVRPAETTVEPVKTARQRLQEIAKDLKVVGIDYGDAPQVIMEDLTKHRTFFLNIGDEIKGVTISDISSRGVVITYEGADLLLQ